MTEIITDQDAKMKATFAAYPRLMLVDVTYRLTNLGMSLFLMMSINGDGESDGVILPSSSGGQECYKIPSYIQT